MVKILVIEKEGSLKEVCIEKYDENSLYKSCLKRKSKFFKKQHVWTIDNVEISLFSKTKGKAGNENKYELPPPLDTILYFEKMLLVCHKNQKVQDLDIPKWKKIYEDLMGGFDDIGEEDSFEEDEEDDIKRGKYGYEHNDFVVSSDDEDSVTKDTDSGDESEWKSSDDDSELDEEEYTDGENWFKYFLFYIFIMNIKENFREKIKEKLNKIIKNPQMTKKIERGI